MNQIEAKGIRPPVTRGFTTLIAVVALINLILGVVLIFSLNSTNTELSGIENSINANVKLLINTDTAALAGNISLLLDNINNINGNIGTIQSQITTLQGSVTTSTDNINGLQQQANNIQGYIISNASSLTSNINSVQSSVSGLSQTVGTLNSDLSGVSSSVSNIQNSVNSLQTETESLNTNQNNISQWIQNNEASTQSQISSINTQIDSLQSTASNLTSSLQHLWNPYFTSDNQSVSISSSQTNVTLLSVSDPFGQTTLLMCQFTLEAVASYTFDSIILQVSDTSGVQNNFFYWVYSGLASGIFYVLCGPSNYNWYVTALNIDYWSYATTYYSCVSV
jgi:predicted  nucleic acid-binding Zn-ribbon protein